MSLKTYISNVAPVFLRFETWNSLAQADIKLKYRRTSLGPWWITVSQGIYALLIGLVSGHFMGSDMKSYLPFFVTGITIWNFFSSALGESGLTLIHAGGMIKAANMPITFYVMRMVQRNFIIFLHNILVIPLVWLIYQWSFDWHILLTFVGFAFLYVFTVSLSLIISVVCTRYRDIPPLIATTLQFLFLTSPILWMPDQLHSGRLIVRLNPISHMIAIVRDPILGRALSLESWAIAGFTTICSALLATFVFSRYRSRIVFWV